MFLKKSCDSIHIVFCRRDMRFKNTEYVGKLLAVVLIRIVVQLIFNAVTVQNSLKLIGLLSDKIAA